MACCTCTACGSGSLCATGVTPGPGTDGAIFSTAPFVDAYVNAYLVVTNNSGVELTVTSDGLVTPAGGTVLSGETVVFTIVGATTITIEEGAGSPSGTYSYELSFNANLPCPTGPGLTP